MLTGGTKTVYSWDTDKGEITQKTETVKNYSEALKNPLVDTKGFSMRLCTNRWTFSNFTLIACVPKFSSISLAISLKNSVEQHK
jgi:hypothetical protein